MSECTGFCLNFAWRSTLKNLMDSGVKGASRNGDSISLYGYSIIIGENASNFVTDPIRKASRAYAAAELLWYLSGTDDATMLLSYAPSYSKFLRGDNTADGAYGARWAQWNQLQLAYEELSKHPDSRRCVITCWEPRDLETAARGNSKDLPCTISLQLLVINECLTMITTMRSNDAWLGMPYDVYCFTSIGRLMAAALGYDRMAYVHQVGCMHLYGKDVEKVGAVLEALSPAHDNNDAWRCPAKEPRSLEALERAINHAVTAEHVYRTNLLSRTYVDCVIAELGADTVLGRALRWCADGLDERRAKAKEAT